MNPYDHWENSLTLLALSMALSAYVGTIRRNLANRCSMLQADIEEKLPRLKGEINSDEERDLAQQKEDEREKQEKKIAFLMLPDALLIVASLLLLVQFLFAPSPSSHSFGFNLAMFLFGIATACLAAQHMTEWWASAQKIRGWNMVQRATAIFALALVIGVAGASLRSCQEPRKRNGPNADLTSLREDIARLQMELDALRVDTTRLKTEMAANRPDARTKKPR